MNYLDSILNLQAKTQWKKLKWNPVLMIYLKARKFGRPCDHELYSLNMDIKIQ